jgi:hypothetical protein
MVANLVVGTHGFGGARDLPVPVWLAVTGGVAALLVSFAVLALAWRQPRYDARTAGRSVPGRLAGVVDSRAFAVALRAAGLAFFGWTTWALVAGRDVLTNPVFGTFYVLVWVGLVPASLLFGPVVRAVSPLRTVAVLLLPRRARSGRWRYPERLGTWPAAIGLFAFVWQELVDPRSAYLGSVRLWLAGYAVAMLLGVAAFGETWFARADPFEVYSTLVAHLSVWGRRDGLLVVRSPLANLDSVPPRPGLVAVVAVLFGSTAFDSFKEMPRWVGQVQGSSQPVLVDTAALAGFCALVGLTLVLAARWTGRRRGDAVVPAAELPRMLAPSIVPIVVGYVAAHYLGYFVEQGQTTLRQLSDPLGDGADLLGTASWPVSYWLSYHPATLASAKVVAVVAGHVVAAVAAHDRALQLLRRRRVRGQLAMLGTMVGYTGGGLYLIFAS